MFSTPESARISDTWPSVRILAADDLTEDGEAFLRRYGVQGYPTLLAVTAGGDLLSGDLLGGRMRSADYLFAALTKAQKANDAFLAERARLLEGGDAESLRKLAKHNLVRRNPEEARALLEKAVKASPDADGYGELVDVLGLLRDREAEQLALDVMIARFTDHENRIGWRMRRATMHVEPPTDAGGRDRALSAFLDAFEALRKEVEAEGSVAHEAVVRLELARFEREKGDAEAAQAHVDWVLERAKDTPHELDARLFLAETAQAKGDDDAAREHAAAVLAVVKEGPPAVRAHMVLGDIAYGEHDLDGVAEHFQAIVNLAPGTQAAKNAQEVLDYLERRRKKGR